MPSYVGVLLSAVVLAALTTVHSQQIKDACYQAPSFVQCGTDNMREYWYNSATKKCQLYGTGTCPGNDNHFKFQEECLRNCTPKEEVCKEAAPTGMCRAAFPRWYYNAATGRCTNFTYGGCNPNANNFETMDDCERYNC